MPHIQMITCCTSHVQHHTHNVNQMHMITWVVLHIWMSHVSHTEDVHVMYINCTSSPESCCTYEWVMPHIHMLYITCTRSYNVHQMHMITWVVLHIWMSHVSHTADVHVMYINCTSSPESCCTCERVMPHIQQMYMWWTSRDMWCTCVIHRVILSHERSQDVYVIYILWSFMWHVMNDSFICATIIVYVMYMWYTSCDHYVTWDVHLLYIFKILSHERSQDVYVKYILLSSRDMWCTCVIHYAIFRWWASQVYGQVMSHTWMSRATHMNGSWYTHEW